MRPFGDQHNDYLGRIRWEEVRNGSGETAPAHALLQVTGTDADGTTVVGKPAADGLTLVLVNGPAEIPAGERGVASVDDHVPALYNPAATPAVGQTWGTAANDWRLTSGKTGFVVSGAADTEAERVAVMRSASGSVLATRNLDGAQVGTTTDLRFDRATGVQITQGASFDTVSLVYGPSLNVVTNVCPVRNDSGVMTGITVERRTVTFPVGTSIGDRSCILNPVDCCPATLDCPGVGSVQVPSMCLVFSNKSGLATCLPNAVPLVARSRFVNFICGIQVAPLHYSPEGSLPNFINGDFVHWQHCGWSSSTDTLNIPGVRVGLGCAQALRAYSDLIVLLGQPPCPSLPTGNDYYAVLNISANSDTVSNTQSPLLPVEVAVDLTALDLSTSGSVFLTTITRTAVASSVDISLAWGDDCPAPVPPPPPSPILTPCCSAALPQVLYVTLSGGRGSYPMTHTAGVWDTGVITVPGCGTFSLRFECESPGSDFVLSNATGGDNTIGFTGSTTLVGCGGSQFFEFRAGGPVVGGPCNGVSINCTVTP